MKFKKIFLLLFIIFLMSGCASVDYSINISKDLQVSEEVFMSATSDYFSIFYMNFPKTIVLEAYNDEETIKPLKDNRYIYEIRNDFGKYPGIFATKQYENLEEYTTNTIYKDQSFEDIIVSNNGNLVTIKTVNFLPYVDDQTDIRYPISDLKINITLPFVVTDNNADSHNKKTNTYTWYINEETSDKEINITFDKTKTYIYNLSMYISLGILLIISIILIFIIIKVVKKNKKNNRV